MKTSKLQIPEYFNGHKELKGLCVGGCIVTGKWSKGRRIKKADGSYLKNKKGIVVREFPAVAHAHTQGQFKGYICFSDIENFLNEKTGKHELAHIITSEGHTKKWAEKYVELISTNKKTAKWLTVEWLQKKYGFDDNGGEGMNIFKEWLKQYDIDEKDLM